MKTGKMTKALALCSLVVVVSCGGEETGGGGDASAVAVADTSPSVDAGQVNNWAQGYTVDLVFHGGPADGRKIRLERDLYDIQTVFSFGSTHYTQGEVGFAMTDTLQIDVDGIQSQVEIILNFGLVIGSEKNPVHVDKAGTYPFSCKPPMVRVFYENFWFRSTCDGLQGSFELTDYANTEGGTMAGSFSGRIQAHFPDTTYPDDCNPEHNAKVCKKADWYADVSGVFGFTLPPKDGGS